MNEEINYLNPGVDNKPEYILCAAIWYKSDEKFEHQPKNIESGYIVCGRRHHNCILIHYILSGKTNSEMNGHIQGFLTSKDRFVDRYEGAKIAFDAGQQNDSNGPMFSEDLY